MNALQSPVMTVGTLLGVRFIDKAGNVPLSLPISPLSSPSTNSTTQAAAPCSCAPSASAPSAC